MTESSLKTIHVFPSQNSYETNKNSVNESDLVLIPITETILNIFYPVGTIYQTSNEGFDPNVSWGGTWIKVENRFLLGSSADKVVGTTGGEENVTLTTNQLPSHTHAGGTTEYTGSFTLGATLSGGGEGVFNFGGRSGQVGTHPTIISGTNKMNFQASNGVSGESGATGNGESHNNMPPYEVVNIWKRTA